MGERQSERERDESFFSFYPLSSMHGTVYVSVYNKFEVEYMFPLRGVKT